LYHSRLEVEPPVNDPCDEATSDAVTRGCVGTRCSSGSPASTPLTPSRCCRASCLTVSSRRRQSTTCATTAPCPRRTGRQGSWR
ncbi:Os01g0693700, partial [Oryza sativa Japonica Group]